VRFFLSNSEPQRHWGTEKKLSYTRLCNLIGNMLRLPADHEKTRLCAHSIIGQILFYAFARPVTSRLAPEMKMTATQIDRIVDHITEFSLAYLRHAQRKPRPISTDKKRQKSMTEDQKPKPARTRSRLRRYLPGLLFLAIVGVAIYLFWRIFFAG